MIKSDKAKKVLGVIVILAIIVSVFGGVASAVDLSGEGVTQSVTDVKIQTAVGNLSSEELTEALDAVTDDTVNVEFADQSAEVGVVSSRSSYDRQAAYNYAYEYWDEVCSDGYFWNTPTGWISLSLGTNIVGWTGYDCAHFVSCCIGSESNEQGGGLPVPEEYPSGPYGIPSSTRLYNWLIDSGNAVEVYSLAQLEKGDVISYDLNENGYPDHTVLYLGNGKIAAHTACYWNVNWDIYNPSAGYYKFVHIKSPTAQPDLVVEDIWVEPDPPIAGASNRIRYKIKNQGTGDAVGTFRNYRYFDGVLQGYADTNGLTAGSTKTYYRDITWPSDSNPHVIKVVTDVNGDISESNEGNNERSESFSAECSTPDAPTLISPGTNSEPGPEIDTLTPTLEWASVSNADYYALAISEYPYGPSYVIYNPQELYGTSHVVLSGVLEHGKKYRWNMQAHNSAGWSDISNTLYFQTPVGITDQQKQQEILNIVNSHRGSLPAELVLAIIRQEGGEGAFHVDGWNYNTFYRESDGPWAQPTNGDGIMQVTTASGYHERSGPYTHDWAGYDHAINDGCDYLLALYNTYGTHVQSTLHYNTGPNSLYIYLGKNWGDRDYLSHVAGHLSNFVPNTYALQNQNLVNTLNQGQNILDKYLDDMGIATGQSVNYYTPYQTQLDSELHNILVTSLIPLTGDMYGNDIDITGFYNTNTAEFTFDGETARFGLMADKPIMYESGTDTIDTYSASKAGFTFDGKTDDIVNNKFTDQGAELGVLSSSSSYDRQAAYNYATQWWNSCNHDCSGDFDDCTPYSYWGSECCGYPSHDGDCANFVSQCIIAGGHPYLNTGDPCRGYPCGKEEIGAKKLGNCLVSMGWERTCGYHASPPSNIDVGDVLIYHKSSCDGGIAHATIVTYVSGSDVRITCHSVNRKNEPYTYMSTSHPYYEWLHYPSQPTIYPLIGDMYKSGTDTTGFYNTGTAEFKFGGKTVNFGQTGDEPIIGDWDGDRFDEIGVFRPSASMFYLVTRNWADLPPDVGAADKDIPFSYPEDIPIAGDWDGDGDDDIGGYYPGTFTFYLYLLNLGSSTPTWYCNVCFGDPGDIPLIGDWDNDGDDDVAVCRKYDIAFEKNPGYYFDLDPTGIGPEINPCKWGNNEDIPITGRWIAGSGDKIGVYRPSTEEFIRNYDIPQIQEECDGTDTSCGIYPNCENCNNYDDWVDTGNMRWVDDPENDCKEKKQKEQEYHNYSCSEGTCTYSVTDTQWIDTGNTQNKPDGTICGCTASNTLKRCYSGVCTDTGICDATTCGADAACDGKRPGDSCGGGICDSNCKCGGQAVGEDIAAYSNGLWFVDTTGDHIADLVFLYGAPGHVPLVGDVNQDGSDDVVIFSNGWWFVDTTGNHIADPVFLYGAPGHVPVVGDINQDGLDDTAVFSDGLWFVDTTGNHIADLVFGYGIAGDVPLVGNIG